MRRLSPERVHQELEKTMEQVALPSAAIEKWESSGALNALIPALSGTPHRLRTAMDFLPMPGPRGRPQRRINRLTALFLAVPLPTLAHTLRDLKFSNSDAAWITELVRQWQRLGVEMERVLIEAPLLAPRTARQWAAAVGRTRIGPLIRIAASVWAAQAADGAPAPGPSRVRAAYRSLLRSAYHDPIEIADLAVDGEDLARAGIPPGPQVGKILRSLLAIVLEDPARNTHSELLAIATAFEH
jgi:hypothetical protein